MKTLVLLVSLSVLSQPVFCGQLVSTWQRVSRSLLTPSVSMLGTVVAGGATSALVGGEVAVGVVAVGLGYFLYTSYVVEGRKLDSFDIGSQILYQNDDGLLSKATVKEVSLEGYDFKITTDEILAIEDVVAYEITHDHDDLGKKVLLTTDNSSSITGHIKKVFTDGFYEINTFDDTLFIHKKYSGLTLHIIN